MSRAGAGLLVTGAEADLALIDPERPWVVNSDKMAAAAGNTPFDKQGMQGRVTALFKGGQPVDGVQTPCVADHCRAIFDRRFLLEEGLEFTKDEIAALVNEARRLVPDIRFEVHDRLIVHPTRTPDDSPSTGRRAIRRGG